MTAYIQLYKNHIDTRWTNNTNYFTDENLRSIISSGIIIVMFVHFKETLKVGKRTKQFKLTWIR